MKRKIHLMFLLVTCGVMGVLSGCGMLSVPVSEDPWENGIMESIGLADMPQPNENFQVSCQTSEEDDIDSVTGEKYTEHKWKISFSDLPYENYLEELDAYLADRCELLYDENCQELEEIPYADQMSNNLMREAENLYGRDHTVPSCIHLNQYTPMVYEYEDQIYLIYPRQNYDEETIEARENASEAIKDLIPLPLEIETGDMIPAPFTIDIIRVDDSDPDNVVANSLDSDDEGLSGVSAAENTDILSNYLNEFGEADAETDTLPAEETYKVPEFLQTLMNDNGSVIGWLVINGTNVNYPIVQNTADNEFFFYHDINGQESISGSIYLDSAHGINEYGLHTVYGREQADGSMFADIADYMDPDYFEKHQSIVIYTGEKKIELTPVYCYTDSADRTYSTAIDSQDELENFLYEKTGQHIPAGNTFIFTACPDIQTGERTYLVLTDRDSWATKKAVEEISLVGTAISNNKIEFFVTEELAENMTDGEQVDAEKNGIRYQGKILHTDQDPSATTGLYRVEADVDLKNEVKTGSAVKVSLDTDISTIGRETEADPWESGMLEAIGLEDMPRPDAANTVRWELYEDKRHNPLKETEYIYRNLTLMFLQEWTEDYYDKLQDYFLDKNAYIFGCETSVNEDGEYQYAYVLTNELETVKESPYLIYIHVYDNKVYFVDMSDPGRNKICISTGELPLVAENVDESYGSDLDRAILANIGWQWCDNKS